MILLLFSILPTLLWDEGPATAPQLEKAGIHEIAVTRDPGSWAPTGMSATQVDVARLIRFDTIGVDYQVGVAGATAAPWVESNLWRMIRDPKSSFLYDVPPASLPLALAEAYAGGAKTYLRVKPENLGDFAAAYRFLAQLHGPPLRPRVNFALVDDRSPEMDEIMNLLVRRNLLFTASDTAHKAAAPQVRIGAPGYPKKSAADPDLFAAMVRSRIDDAKRLVRVYGSETVLVRLYGDEWHARLHLLQYGRGAATGVRIRVLGEYPRVYLSGFKRTCSHVTDIVVEKSATEFSIPELGPFAVVDLEGLEPAVLHSARARADQSLTADPTSDFWAAAPPVHTTRDVFGAPAGLGDTEVRSRWTPESIYLLFICPFERLNLKPGPVTDRETPSLWQWDVAEAFIGVIGAGGVRYREFEISPQAEWLDLDINCGEGDLEHHADWNSGVQVRARIDYDRRIWYGAMRIPTAALGALAARAGDRLPIGLFRTAGQAPGTKLVSWQPTYRRSFHVPEAFGGLLFDPVRTNYCRLALNGCHACVT